MNDGDRTLLARVTGRRDLTRRSFTKSKGFVPQSVRERISGRLSLKTSSDPCDVTAIDPKPV